MDTRTLDGLAELLGPFKPQRVYEIGSRNLNGTVRELFRGAAQYHGIDVRAGDGVDVVADGLAHEPPFVPDCVACCEVLEHTPDAELLVRRMAAVVAPGGRVLVSCAGRQRDPHSAEDGAALRAGEFYQGLDHEDLAQWMLGAGLTDVRTSLSCFPETDPTAGDGAHDIYVIGTKPATKTRPQPTPLTVIDADVKTTPAEMAARVLKTRTDHAETLQKYHDVWYNAPHTWHYLHFLGVGTMKCPNDLWMYQELITEYRPRTVVETGTYMGASALYFAFLMDMLKIDGGKVYTIDFEDRRRCDHPRIVFLDGDSTDPELAAAVLEQVQYPLLVSLDADHSAEHVRKELELYAPAARVGDWVIVEDTNISWGGPKGDRGARGGAEDYLTAHQGEFRQDILCERWLLSMNPGGWLQRVAECTHG